MTKENLEKLEQKIRELVPRLRELSFGCEVLDTKYNDRYRLAPITAEINGRNIDIGGDPCCCGNIYRLEGRFEVIGHPITLEAVLEAVGLGLAMDFAGAINAQGYLILTWTCECLDCGVEPKTLTFLWKLDKPWEEQEQVHNFLFNLFFNDSK